MGWPAPAHGLERSFSLVGASRAGIFGPAGISVRCQIVVRTGSDGPSAGSAPTTRIGGEGGVIADALVYGYTHHPALTQGDPATRPASRCPPTEAAHPTFSSAQSGVEEMEEPARPDHVGPEGLGPPPQLAIRRDEPDRPVGRVCHHVDECVIAASVRVDDRDAVGVACLHSLARLALEDDDDRSVDPSRVSSRSYLIHERPGGACPVAPPARRTGSDHIGGVNHEHRSPEPLRRAPR
jgi:hypothetical protein